MRACTATTLSARYRDPVIRPSIDSMIFRNDFEKKTTSTDNANHPRGTALFLRLWDTTLRDSSIAGNKALCDSCCFHSRPVLSLSLSASSSVPLQFGICRFPLNLALSSYKTIFEYRLPFLVSFRLIVTVRWSEVLNETRSCKSARKSHIPDESRDGASFFRSAAYGLRPTN